MLLKGDSHSHARIATVDGSGLGCRDNAEGQSINLRSKCNSVSVKCDIPNSRDWEASNQRAELEYANEPSVKA